MPACVQVMPWYWYRDEGARLASGHGSAAAHVAEASEVEVRRMRNALSTLRADTYYDINESLKKAVAELQERGAPEALQLADVGAVLPKLRGVSSELVVRAHACMGI